MGRVAFMGGCALSSYNPELVINTIKHLRKTYPDLSVVQKCCGKPTKAIGQEELFHKRYDGLTQDLKDIDADTLIVACQSCYKIMKLNENIKVISLWSLLPKIGLPKEAIGKAKDSNAIFSIQDSCSIRPYAEIFDGIRWIMNELGYQIEESSHTRENTRCCGFGGMVVPANPEVALKVMKRRVGDFKTDCVVTYCAACRQSMLSGGAKAWHILDLVYGPVVHKEDQAPFDTLGSTINAWGNRLKTKMSINRLFK